MNEKNILKAFRLPSADNEAIERFLKGNPVFDFSTLARTALLLFIQNPQMELKRVSIEETLRKSFKEDKDELDGLAGESHPRKRSSKAR